MIVNLIGPIASGKSSFAKWFINRHPKYIHLDIAELRATAQFGHKVRLRDVEAAAWQMMKDGCMQKKYVVVETTGVIHHQKLIWDNPLIISKGIYTIKFWADRDICKTRAKARKVTKIPGYDLDDCYGIEIEAKLISLAPSNLIVYTNDNTQEQEELYTRIEDEIKRAERYFQLLNARPIGQNNI